MVQIIVSGTGEGKTKQLIEMANNDVKVIDGSVIFIDDDKRHIYDLSHKIRFVEVTEFPLANYRELIGFIYGILSQNSDIQKIYIDGIFSIIEKLNNEDLIKLVVKLKNMGDKYGIDFIASANKYPNEMPKEISDVIVPLVNGDC